MLQIQILNELKYAACSWDEFIHKCENIDLKNRAKYSPAPFVVWDTIGDKNSYLRVGDDLATIAMQAVIELKLVPIEMDTSKPLIVVKNQVYYAPFLDWQESGKLLSISSSYHFNVSSTNTKKYSRTLQ